MIKSHHINVHTLFAPFRHVTSYIEKKMAENSWYDPRVVLRYKGEEEKGT